jgi:ubiquinone/menaquinone biosynthesis C-methylase UbiE
MLRAASLRLASGPLAAAYGRSTPVMRWLCRDERRRAVAERLLRMAGTLLVWAARGRRQDDPGSVAAEWTRVLRRLGLQPETSAGCQVCFQRCSLALGPGDRKVCETAMAINDQMIARLGGQMVLHETLADAHGTRCRVEIVRRRSGPRERAPWCDATTARSHFDRAAPFYDFIMGYFEIPSNRKCLRDLSFDAAADPDAPAALELGVGTGLGLAALVRRLPPAGRVIAVDTSPGMIRRASARIARRGQGGRVQFIEGDAAHVPLPDASVDTVFSSFLLDLLPREHRVQVLRESRRVARPGATAHWVVMDAAPRRALDRALSALYNAGYQRWNPIWMTLFRGYAPHCRPIDLAPDLEAAGWHVEEKTRSYVSLFPVAIFRARRA